MARPRRGHRREHAWSLRGREGVLCGIAICRGKRRCLLREACIRGIGQSLGGRIYVVRLRPRGYIISTEIAGKIKAEMWRARDMRKETWF